MAYIKNNWVDREGTTRYFETVDNDGAKIFTPDYTQVTELGTPVNADNMNHIEEGIAAGSFTKYDTKSTYAKDDLVTVIEEASPVIYKSLQDNNIGNALSDSAYWEKISLGGGGGLEIGDIGFTQMAIDETKGKRRKLNGQLIIQEQYVELTNIIKNSVALNPDLACTEAEWQTEVTMNTFGLCGKFVIDDEAGTIRLPKYPNHFVAGLANIAPVVGNGMALRFSDTQGNAVYTMYGSQVGDYTGGTIRMQSIEGSYLPQSRAVTLPTASLLENNCLTSGMEAQIDEKQIVGAYFIQVATGAETEDNIINEIELNNPYSFGDSKYSPVALNNLSWLKSEGQYNSKAVYPAYYEWLLKIYNGVEVVDGVSVKLTTEEYTDYDWVLNTADETFRLPLLDGSEDLVSDRYENLILEASGTNYTAPANGWYVLVKNSSASGQYLNMSNTDKTASQIYSSNTSQSLKVNLQVHKGDRVNIQYSLGGDTVVFRFTYAQGNGSLYFYVGETVQNANLINAGRIEETLVKKVDMQQATIASFPSDRYIDLTLGASGAEYTAPANGWVILQAPASSTSSATATLSRRLGDATMDGAFTARAFTTGTKDTWMYCYIPVKKGDIFYPRYSNITASSAYFRFIYAEGEV